MYQELGAIKETVDLTSDQALDRAAAFLSGLGYAVMRRTANSVTAERREGGEPKNVTVDAHPQPGGGVSVKVRGTDGDGVRARQAEWGAWSEGLPKLATAPATASLPPPTPVPTQPLPPPDGSDFGRGVRMTLGGCLALVVIVGLLGVGLVGCLAVLGGSGALDDPTSPSVGAPAPSADPAVSGTPSSVVVRVSGSPGVAFSGSYGTGSEGGRSVEGVLGAGAAEYPVAVEAGAFEFDIVTAFFSKMDEGGSLRVEIVVDGQVVKSQETSATYGAVDVTYSPQVD